jgi:chloramphenicol-sensitive protein RarD
MKALAHVPAFEVLVHRVIWSLPIAALVVWFTGRHQDLFAALRNPKMLGMAALTAGLISANWGIYVWAIANDRALDAALGYYINPLFSVFLGAVLLGERLTRRQQIAIFLAFLAVVILTYEAGHLPLLSLGLPLTFGCYAFLKKSLPIGPNQGFFLEILLLTPLALSYMAYLEFHHAGHFFMGSTSEIWLLLGCGVVTAVPLILYGNGAKFLRMSTNGFLQYSVPSMIFLMAVFVFHEPLSQARLLAFTLIWVGLALFSVDLIRPKPQEKC